MASNYKQSMTLNSKQRRKVATISNTFAFRHYQSLFKELAMVRGEWNELPKEINVDYVNESMLEYDQVFFKDEEVDEYLILRCVLTGSLDPYGVPIYRDAYGMNGYYHRLDKTNSVLIKCRPCRIGDMVVTPMEAINYYAQHIADIDRTIATNIKRQKLPWVLSGDAKASASIDALFADIDNNVPFVQVDTDFQKYIQAINLQAPLVAPQLYALKQSFIQEALMCLGIPNSSIEKKERVNTREVEANNSGTIMYRYVLLDPITRACKEINEMFGLNVSYEFRNNVDASIDGTNDEDADDEEDEVIDDDNA